MPPKVSATTSDNEKTDTGLPVGMGPDEVSFLMTCLLHPTGGTVLIDTQAVADARGQKNKNSVGNRISAMRKKYNLPIAAGKSTTATATESGTEANVPLTPHKQRVTKSRAVAKGTTKNESEEEGDEEDSKPAVEEKKKTAPRKRAPSKKAKAEAASADDMLQEDVAAQVKGEDEMDEA